MKTIKKTMSTLLLAVVVLVTCSKTSANIFLSEDINPLNQSNILIVNDVFADPGDVITVSVDVENEDVFVSFMLDIPLPENFEYQFGSAELSDRKADHTIASNVLDGNVLRILSYSMTNSHFSGNDGTLFTFTIETPENEGVWSLIPQDIYLTAPGSEDYINILTASYPGTVVLGSPMYDVELNAMPDDAGAVLLGAGTYNYAEMVIIEANDVDVYTFYKWTGSAEVIELLDDQYAMSTFFVMPAFDVELTAQYVNENIHEVEVDVNPQGAGTATGAGFYLTFDTVTLQALENEGYSFVNWTVLDEAGEEVVLSTENIYEFEMGTESISITANFELNENTLSLIANPISGGVLTGEGDYYYQETVEVQAFPADGHGFVSWQLDDNVVSTNEVYSFLMPDKDISLIANFTTPLYTLTLIALPDAGGSAYGEGDYEENELVDLLAVPETNYVFLGWSLEDVIISYDEEFQFTMPAENTLILALFEHETNVQNIAQNNISVFPNPSKDIINVVSDVIIEKIQIIDINGKEIYLDLPSSKNISINLRVEAGIYFAKITTENQTQTIKLLFNE